MEGKIKEIIKGKIEVKIEVAQNMLAMVMSVELIIQITGLSEEEIKRLG